MNQDRHWMIGYNLLFGLLGLGALINEIVINDKAPLALINFFSYFTIESVSFATGVLLLTAFWGIRGKRRAPKWLVMLRGAMTLYMLITGLIYIVLLSGWKWSVFIDGPWHNIVMHYLMPVAILVGWIFEPAARTLGFRRALVWLVYPLLYRLYILIHGAVTGWYPYPFIDPAVHSYGFIGLMIGALLVLTASLTWFLVRLPRAADGS